MNYITEHLYQPKRLIITEGTSEHNIKLVLTQSPSWATYAMAKEMLNRHTGNVIRSAFSLNNMNNGFIPPK